MGLPLPRSLKNMVQLSYCVLDGAIALPNYITVGGKGRHLPTTDDISYSRKENKRMYSQGWICETQRDSVL